MPPNGTDWVMSKHVCVRGTSKNFESKSERDMMIDNGQTTATTKLGVSIDVSRFEGVLEATRDRVLGDLLQELEHVIVCTVHREVVMDTETFWRYRLHRFHLIEHIFER